MKSVRRIKKELKKIYAESLLKGTMPVNIFGEPKATLIFHYNSWSMDSSTTRIRQHSIEICQHHYDYHNGDSDSWDISRGLKSKNKNIPYKGKIKFDKLKFYFIYC